jgi:hypothetical protein
MRLLDVAFKPRSTMRQIQPSHRAVIALVFAAFLSSVMGNFNVQGARLGVDSFGVGLTILFGILACLVGGAIAVGLFYVFAWIATIAGTWLEGTGSTDRVRTALAWGFAPMILALIYRIPALLLWPDAATTRSKIMNVGEHQISVSAVNAPAYQLAILMSLNLIFLAWYLIVASQTLAETQGFSSWRGLANLMIAYVLPFVAIAILVVAALLAFR